MTKKIKENYEHQDNSKNQDDQVNPHNQDDQVNPKNQDDLETIVVTAEEAGTRLDKILADRYEGVYSRTYFQNLIADHNVLVNDAPVKKNLKPNEGDEIDLCFTLTPEIDVVAENIPLDILYEDENIIAVNKPAGMVVHPAVGNWSGTFVNALLYHCQTLPGTSDLRPGIVHRLDKDTSGVLIAAKTHLAHQKLIEMFASRQIHKEYLAICLGNCGSGTISEPIGRHPIHRKKMTVCEEGGRHAVTHYKSLAHNDKVSLVSLVIETGRTHQIRVHMQHHKTPVLGDDVYGNTQTNERFKVKRQMLHAHKLKFNHPVTKFPLEIIAPLPDDMAKWIHQIKPEISL